MVLTSPLCTKVSFTLVSGAIMPMVCANWRESLTVLPLTAVITSPVSIPALAAGLAGSG